MKPVLQSAPIDFTEIEDKLGFKIHPSIKEYLSTYWFDDIEGFFQYKYVHLNGLLSNKNMINVFKYGFVKDDFNYLKKQKYFLIGITDSEDIFVNNETGEVIRVICYEHSSNNFANSIEEFIKGIDCEV